jgi:ferritin-like protein
MKTLAKRHPERLLDLLNERLTFERMSVKLYDMILTRMKRSKDRPILGMVGQMTKQRDEVKEHEEWLEDRVRELGSDAHTMTESAELVDRESRGLLEVVMSVEELPQLFHALLAAELVDDTGWKLLLQLADEAGDDDARRDLRRRALEQEEHMVFTRSVVAAFARTLILGKTVQMPVSP